MRIFSTTTIGSALLIASSLFSASAMANNAQKVNHISYAIGWNMGTNLKSQNIKVKPEAIMAGMEAALQGEKSELSEKEINAALQDFQKQLLAKQNKAFESVSERNLKEGKSFLMTNKDKKDVVTLPSGLQYKIIKAGTGAKPTKNDKVTVDYEGKLINGKVFDSSYKRGQPATFGVTQVIPGWTEALQLMKTGATWELFIPSDLAYGEHGAGGAIGPNQMLIFKVHLISIN